MRDCFICGGASATEFHARVEAQDYVRCSRCGLIYVDQVLPTAELYHAYDGGILKAWRRKIVAPFRGFAQVRGFAESMARADRIVDFVAGLRPNHQSQPSWLDIGCNKGFLLAAAIARGWDVHGIELVPELVVPFKRKYKRFAGNIHTQRFTDVQSRLPDHAFDVISAIDVIEHFEDPRSDLSGIRRILKPGGLLVVQTPDGAAAQTAESAAGWGALKPLEHLHLFNAANLEILAGQLRFEEIRFFEPFEVADGNLVALLR